MDELEIFVIWMVIMIYNYIMMYLMYKKQKMLTDSYKEKSELLESLIDKYENDIKRVY